jgi:hypothetical protein
MIKQISLIAIVAIGIGALFLGTSLAPAFATVPAGCTGNAHAPGATGNAHAPGATGNAHAPGATGNAHVSTVPKLTTIYL